MWTDRPYTRSTYTWLPDEKNKTFKMKHLQGFFSGTLRHPIIQSFKVKLIISRKITAPILVQDLIDHCLVTEMLASQNPGHVQLF